MTQYPTKIEELPTTEFYAILTPESVKTTVNFGPPDPPNQEVTNSYWNMQVFPTKEQWEAEVRRLSLETGYYRTPFKAVVVCPVTVKTTISVEVG